MSGIGIDEIILDGQTSSVAIQDAGGDELDINADGSLNAIVTATDLDIRNLLFASDAVDVSGSSVTVTATDLDIRNLINTSDSTAVGDSTNLVTLEQSDDAFVGAFGFAMYGVRQDASGSPVSATGDAHPFVFNSDGELKTVADLSSDTADDAADAGNPIKVGGRGVSGALTALSATNDRYDLLGDLYRRTWVNTSRNIAISNTNETVTTSAAEVLTSALAGRREVTIQNEGNVDVFLGSSGSVTTANGTKISKNSSATFEWGEDIGIFMIATSGSQDVRFLEAA